MKKILLSFFLLPSFIFAQNYSLPQSIQDLLKRGTDKVLIIDVRTTEEYATGHLSEALNIPLEKIPSSVDPSWKIQSVAVYCKSGVRSAQAAHALREAGFIKVYDLGGISQYGTAQIKTPIDAVLACDSVIAKVGDRTFTGHQLQEVVEIKIRQNDKERYEILEKATKDWVEQILLEIEASVRNETIEQLLKSEIIDKLTQPDEKVLKDSLAQEQADQPVDPNYPEAQEFRRQELIIHLQEKQAVKLRDDFLNSLKIKYKATINLDSPVVTIGPGSLPCRGDANAPITIIMFADFQCPYCHETEKAIQELLASYPGKIKLFYRDFPLSSHPQALQASQAARAAAAQGKFWEYHDLLETVSDWNNVDYISLAKQLKLDTNAFSEEWDSPEIKALIDIDKKEGKEKGIDSSPTIFVNGHELNGEQSYLAIKEVIDQELTLK